MKRILFIIIPTITAISSAAMAQQAYYKNPDSLFSRRPDAAAPISHIQRFGPVGLSIDLMQPAFVMHIKGTPAHDHSLVHAKALRNRQHKNLGKAGGKTMITTNDFLPESPNSASFRPGPRILSYRNTVHLRTETSLPPSVPAHGCFRSLPTKAIF